MSQPDEPKHRSGGRILGAIALIVLGLLFLVPSGLCTSFFGYMAIMGAVSGQAAKQDVSSVVSVLLVGLPFIAIGAALVLFGIRLMRRK